MKKLWKSVKLQIWQIVGALISDTKPNGKLAVSLGRVCFLAVLVFMFVLWRKSLYKPIEMPPGLLEVFYTLAGYVFGSKAIAVLRSKVAGTPTETPEDE